MKCLMDSIVTSRLRCLRSGQISNNYPDVASFQVSESLYIMQHNCIYIYWIIIRSLVLAHISRPCFPCFFLYHIHSYSRLLYLSRISHTCWGLGVWEFTAEISRGRERANGQLQQKHRFPEHFFWVSSQKSGGVNAMTLYVMIALLIYVSLCIYM